MVLVNSFGINALPFLACRDHGIFISSDKRSQPSSSGSKMHAVMSSVCAGEKCG